jgi:hypothetical protein
MITMPSLQTALLDLLHEVQGTEVKLIIEGGYGIYLKNNHVRRMGNLLLRKRGSLYPNTFRLLTDWE